MFKVSPQHSLVQKKIRKATLQSQVMSEVLGSAQKRRRVFLDLVAAEFVTSRHIHVSCSQDL